MKKLTTLLALLLTSVIYGQQIEVEGDIDVKNNKITNLADPTVPTDAANKAYVDLLEQRIYDLEFNAGNDTITDFDGNMYKIVKLDDQYWMAKNLLTTHYNDGTAIALVTDTVSASGWVNLTTPAYCWPSNDQDSLKFFYGAFYNYFVVADTNTRNPCPVGWKVPSDADWDVLSNFLTNNGFGFGGSGIDIGKSMASPFNWFPSAIPGQVGNDQNSNNSSGFNGLPSGFRSSVTGLFSDYNSHCYWWTSTPTAPNHAHIRDLVFDSAELAMGFRNRKNGFSIRCIKN